ncbi:MAG: hypothetical protein K2N42_00865, partial [Anaeroplasmataceae bacterium]|nr:hypothetical protein [Anaeroplasmataceae bacterium]
MTYEIKKKERIHRALINVFDMYRISLIVLIFVVGLATGLLFIGKNGYLYVLRIAISIYIGSGVYLAFHLILLTSVLVRFLIKLKRYKEKVVKYKDVYSIDLDILEDGQLQIKALDISVVIKKSQIKWVKEHKTYISFYIAIYKRKY